MARYIDADAWLEELKIEYTEMWESNCLSELQSMQDNAKLQEVIMARPTADVVPKSEVDRFAEEIKLEFYREFDEIIPSIMADKIDELKKKYTESEDKP